MPDPIHSGNMDVDSDTASKLSNIASGSSTDRLPAYTSLLYSVLSPGIPTSDLISYGRHFTQSSSLPSVASRRALGLFVLAVCANAGMEDPPSPASGPEGKEDQRIADLGRAYFNGKEGHEKRREVVEGVLAAGTATWCDEQVTTLRLLLSHLLQQEEEWVDAARALIAIPLEGGERGASKEAQMRILIRIVRLYLEAGESGQAQTYFSKATLLAHDIQDKALLLSYKLSQARLFDFSARFNEAAGAYHRLSFESIVDPDERTQMLKSAVTTSILAPSGPLRSHTLASLHRDDRIHSSLPPYLPTMLTKMLMERIIRPEEVGEFEAGLEEHQKARVEGGGTVVERAVREHNAGACGKVYDNISFDALGVILGLDADAAESTARRMIEQGRLRAWIDQPLHLLHFESRSSRDTADAQGTAGGLGVQREEKEVEPVTWTERWDERIWSVSTRVERLAAEIQSKGLLANSPGHVTLPA